MAWVKSLLNLLKCNQFPVKLFQVISVVVLSLKSSIFLEFNNYKDYSIFFKITLFIE